MPKSGHRPERTCLGCGARGQQRSLIRLTAAGQELKIDRSGNGRGGYLHNDPACWQRFLRRKSVYRAWRVEISRGSRERLLEQLVNQTGSERDGKDESPSVGERTGH